MIYKDDNEPIVAHVQLSIVSGETSNMHFSIKLDGIEVCRVSRDTGKFSFVDVDEKDVDYLVKRGIDFDKHHFWSGHTVKYNKIYSQQ